jgi:predicted RNase H-like nuclease (RuvC/YqgF family)
MTELAMQELDGRVTEYGIQGRDLHTCVRVLAAERTHLRRKLGNLIIAERRLGEANRELAQAFTQNEQLVNALYEAREQITALKEEVAKNRGGSHAVP